MVFQWRSFLIGTLLGGSLVGAWAYLSSPEAESLQAGDSGVGAEAVEGRSEVLSLRARLDTERARAEERARERDHVEPPPPVRKRPKERISELEDRARERRVPPRESPKIGKEWFNSEGLRALGIPDSEIERIEEVWQEYLMHKLRIENEIARQKGKGKGKEAARWNLVNEDNARVQLGDENYDAMLYASGDRNRVFISQLLENSPGESAGLMAEDEVIFYDRERIFRPSEIKRLTTEGSKGDFVEIQVVRGGELMRFFLPRGPIGAQLHFRVSPPFGLR